MENFLENKSVAKICLILAIIIMVILSLSPIDAKSQVIVNDADSSVVLDIQSTSGGILISRMTEAQRDSISEPANGLLIYQTTVPMGFYFWDGVQWNRLVSENAEGIIQYGEAEFSGEPSQELFESVFGIRQFHFHFTLLSTNQNKVFTGAYITGHGFFYEKLKQ
ncbi:MAG: hypothetical protein WC812_03920 [Candidatus Pacearchaeota archaeon]|jgi:hypothetical protein